MAARPHAAWIRFAVTSDPGWALLPAGRREIGPTSQLARNGMERLLDGNSILVSVEEP
jgi:hypothetical protein